MRALTKLIPTIADVGTFLWLFNNNGGLWLGTIINDVVYLLLVMLYGMQHLRSLYLNLILI